MKYIRLIKKLLIALIVFSLVFIVPAAILFVFSSPRPAAENFTIIAHANGGVFDESGKMHIYTNSLEAFEYNYGLGTRVFEIDFAFTSCGELVGVHRWESRYFDGATDGKASFKHPLSLAEFQSVKLGGLWTGLTFDDMLNLMESYIDVTVIIDTKERDYEKFYTLISDKIALRAQSVKDRIVPQIFSFAHYEFLGELERDNPYRHYIFNLTRYIPFRLFALRKINRYEKIDAVSVSALVLPLANLNAFKNVRVYIYAYRNESRTNRLPRRGIDGIFMDDIKRSIT